MLVLILGTGLYLMLGLKFMPLVRLGVGFRLLWQGRSKDDESSGEISPFQALMTCLAATVGTGNIAGVATAIFLGGPGALFWMWCTALVGMATKFSEVVLAVHYREKDERNEHVGGPMYAIKNGLGKRWAWLGAAFALFGGLAGFGIGNMVQVNSMADALEVSFGVPDWVTGVATMLVTGLVILGGIRRIGKVAEALVPFMCVGYIVASVIVLVVHAEAIPGAFQLIFTHAFTPIAATGGFAGAAVMAAIRFGVARGIFSNEAGLGTAGIAQAAGTTHSAVRSGLIGMLGTFIDTLIICSLTGLGDHHLGRLDQRRQRRGAVLGGVRGGDAGRRPLHPVAGPGGVRLYHHPRLELLRRALLGVPGGHPGDPAVPDRLDPGDSVRRHDPAGLRLAGGGYPQRADGDSQPDRLAAAESGGVPPDPGVFRQGQELSLGGRRRSNPRFSLG
ncbi:amino acid carrier protein [Pseudomonas aeruginosa]|nr:amino acid carrier protein [Pseudomonas aeruginosa]